MWKILSALGTALAWSSAQTIQFLKCFGKKIQLNKYSIFHLDNTFLLNTSLKIALLLGMYLQVFCSFKNM